MGECNADVYILFTKSITVLLFIIYGLLFIIQPKKI